MNCTKLKSVLNYFKKVLKFATPIRSYLKLGICLTSDFDCNVIWDTLILGQCSLSFDLYSFYLYWLLSFLPYNIFPIHFMLLTASNTFTLPFHHRPPSKRMVFGKSEALPNTYYIFFSTLPTKRLTVQFRELFAN